MNILNYGDGRLDITKKAKSWVPSQEKEVTWLVYTILDLHTLLYNQPIHSMINVILRLKAVLNLIRR